MRQERRDEADGLKARAEQWADAIMARQLRERVQLWVEIKQGAKVLSCARQINGTFENARILNARSLDDYVSTLPRRSKHVTKRA